MMPPTLGHPICQISAFLYAYEKQGNAIGLLKQNHQAPPTIHRVL